MDLSRLAGTVLSRHEEAGKRRVFLLVRTHTEYVTCFVNMWEAAPVEWNHGRYFKHWPAAVADFCQRVMEAVPQDD